MNKISKICGIFAVGTMMLSTFFVTSCNSEDDFDFGPDSQYSLADRKMTRAGENNNSSGVTEENYLIIKAGNDTVITNLDDNYQLAIYLSWPEGPTAIGNDFCKVTSIAALITLKEPDTRFPYKNYYIVSNSAYWAGSSGIDIRVTILEQQYSEEGKFTGSEYNHLFIPITVKKEYKDMNNG